MTWVTQFYDLGLAKGPNGRVLKLLYRLYLFRKLSDRHGWRAGIIADRGYSPTRKQAMQDFEARWVYRSQ